MSWADTVHGLIIGIDDYKHVEPLDGSVNDARDIAQALGRAGAKDVILLLNDQASRAAIMKAWTDLVGRSAPGDTIFLTFSGHGAQVADSKGQLQRFVVLPQFDVRGAAAQEIILDNEFGGLLRAIPDRKAVFVIDSCHAGTMTRSYGGKRHFKVRSVAVPQLSGDNLNHSLADTNGEVALPHVVHLGAVSRNEVDPEVVLGERPRGALSFAVARAIEGAADANRDGRINAEELENFVRGVVGSATDGQQHPTIVVPNGWSFAVQGPAGAVEAIPFPALPPLPFAITADGHVTDLAARFHGTTLVSPDIADITWDVPQGVLTSRFGDVLSFPRGFNGANVSDGDVILVQHVIDKISALRTLKAMAVEHGWAIDLFPGDGVHFNGERVAFSVRTHANPYLTVFNLASDGTVNFLYPRQDGRRRDPLELPMGQSFALDLQVQPPFGADHLVAIASKVPLLDLHRRLKAWDGQFVTGSIAGDIQRMLEGATYEMGIHPTMTAPRR